MSESDEAVDASVAELSDLFLPRPEQFGECVVIARNVMKEFGEVKALKGVSLLPVEEMQEGAVEAIRRGEFVMIRGASGGGKSTLLSLLGTLDYPTGGTIELFGDTVTQDSTDEYLSALRLKRIGFVFQSFNLLSSMSALENVELPMLMAASVSQKEARQRAVMLLGQVGLGDRLGHLPSELSGGEQQRVAIARALANNPELLLLDEPTGDLDVRNTVEVMDLLASINAESGTTMLMVTHNPDLETYADRIIYIGDGVVKRVVQNTRPCRLPVEAYSAHLNAAHEQEEDDSDDLNSVEPDDNYTAIDDEHKDNRL